MSSLSRILLAIAALLLLVALRAPLWRIQLVAPQYPEGLGMEIHAQTVHGASEHDLDNINELNHYIGMKVIRPDAIPELHVIPWVLAGLAAFGVIAAATGKGVLGWAWLGAFVTAGVVGLVDFWRWEYDYGHHLDMEHAIIKVPGMTYQPPLIGSKQLLNFTAVSWPGIGGIVLGVSFLLGVAALVLARRGARKATAVSGA